MDVSTTGKRTRTEQCQRNAQAKSERKRQTAFEALALLQQEGKVVTKAAIARRAGVSVVFLRRHPDLVQAIEEAEQRRFHDPALPSPDRTKDQVIAALRRRLDEMKQALGKKDVEFHQKQREIDRLYGKLAAGSVLTDPELRSALPWPPRSNGLRPRKSVLQPSRARSSSEMVAECTDPTPTGLVVIARNTTGQIITRITSHRDLVGAMHTGRCVLKLKLDAARVEVHHGGSSTSDYSTMPLAAISRDDLLME